MQNKQVKALCSMVEQKFGLHPVSTHDFAEISRAIERATKEHLSVSTLKRCFGRFPIEISPRQSTLNIIARYVGYSGWADFINKLKISDITDSDFQPVNAIKLSTLPPGTRLVITWMPDREIHVQYIGNSQFRIDRAVNTKLQSGDIITIAMLAIGQPMFISSILRENGTHIGYVAGQRYGVNVEME